MMKDTDGETSGRASRRASKSSRAFRTISEVSKLLDVPQHVLRFWESKFTQIKPMKRGGGRRYYRPEDTVLLTRIRDLLYNEGYTIRGVQKLLREKGIKSILADGADLESSNLDINDQPAILDAIADRGGNPGSDTLELKQVDRMELISIRDELLSIRNALAGLS